MPFISMTPILSQAFGALAVQAASSNFAARAMSRGPASPIISIKPWFVQPSMLPAAQAASNRARAARSEEHTSELQSLMRISYAVFCLKKKNKSHSIHTKHTKEDRHESDKKDPKPTIKVTRSTK